MVVVVALYTNQGLTPTPRIIPDIFILLYEKCRLQENIYKLMLFKIKQLPNNNEEVILCSYRVASQKTAKSDLIKNYDLSLLIKNSILYILENFDSYLNWHFLFVFSFSNYFIYFKANSLKINEIRHYNRHFRFQRFFGLVKILDNLIKSFSKLKIIIRKPYFSIPTGKYPMLTNYLRSESFFVKHQPIGCVKTFHGLRYHRTRQYAIIIPAVTCTTNDGSAGLLNRSNRTGLSLLFNNILIIAPSNIILYRDKRGNRANVRQTTYSTR
ncbi:hypothetical protein AGLY_009404 [Aphis glycines]|uniref:Uncharacterized protein n=1 Tax=Aphis glycines TaxID=307491 RepID=A0A6G0THC4_APHGL|nr:hypothetical protein AGLY_009404 [Aphis glycines]